MKCTELIINDHAILRRALGILEAMVTKLEHGERIEVFDALTILKFIRNFGVEYHQTMEEQVVFPALLRAVPKDGPIRHMLFEHTEHRSLLTTIEEALKARKGTQFVRNARGLMVLLRNHFDREDNVLRSLDTAWISSEEDDAILAALTEHRRQPEKLANLTALECKYVSKPIARPLTPQRGFVRAQGSAAG